MLVCHYKAMKNSLLWVIPIAKQNTSFFSFLIFRSILIPCILKVTKILFLFIKQVIFPSFVQYSEVGWKTIKNRIGQGYIKICVCTAFCRLPYSSNISRRASMLRQFFIVLPSLNLLVGCNCFMSLISQLATANLHWMSNALKQISV